jgi:biopolymer transport protein TolR
MAMGGSSDGSMLAEINVTPLVDVMLVLLIIFMVTAPLIQQGVDVELPEASAQQLPDDEGKLILTVTKDQKVFLGQTEVPLKDLEDKVRHNAKVQAEREIYLHADKTLPYGVVVQIMAVIKQAGVEKLGMVTDPLEYETQGAR